MTSRRALLFGGAALLSGCALPEGPACRSGVLARHGLGVRGRGWHTEILLSAATLPARLSGLPMAWPGTAVLGLGFGKRDWMLGHNSALLTAPLPGPGVIEFTAYGFMPRPPLWQVPVSAEGLDALWDFVWRSLALADGAPRLAAPPAHGQTLLEAAPGYSLAYTCNTWVAEALATAGLAVNPAGVALASGVLAQVARLPGVCMVPAAPIGSAA